jgi:hypothetical protein
MRIKSHYESGKALSTDDGFLSLIHYPQEMETIVTKREYS